jgi:hypothetical protein
MQALTLVFRAAGSLARLERRNAYFGDQTGVSTVEPAEP